MDAVVKNMPQIQNSFSCFRFTPNGKIRGGTQRTKTYTLGFGQLPRHTIGLDGGSFFMSYTHIYGEFGLTFVTNRTPRVKRNKNMHN